MDQMISTFRRATIVLAATAAIALPMTAMAGDRGDYTQTEPSPWTHSPGQAATWEYTGGASQPTYDPSSILRPKVSVMEADTANQQAVLDAICKLVGC